MKLFVAKLLRTVTVLSSEGLGQLCILPFSQALLRAVLACFLLAGARLHAITNCLCYFMNSDLVIC